MKKHKLIRIGHFLWILDTFLFSDAREHPEMKETRDQQLAEIKELQAWLSAEQKVCRLHRVTWCDHEGNQQEHEFDSMEDAWLEAIDLRKRYTGVEIDHEPI